MDQFLWAFSPGGDGTHPQNAPEKDDLRRASRDAQTAAREVSELKEKIKHLELINRAIWELLRDAINLTEEDLLKKVSVCDLEQEVASPKSCTACNRPNAAKRSRCLYCGENLPINTAFDRV